MEPKIAQLVLSLAQGGWTHEDFAANHLAYVASLCLGTETDSARNAFDRYWRTVAHITRILQEAGIFHVIIKTRRNYPYADRNVDVFIREGDWPEVRDRLCGALWRMPARWVIAKQRLIEREKIKLPARKDTLVPAHIYKAVSWRYQREVTFLDPKMIERIPLNTEAPGLEAETGPVMVPVPSRPADILLHCAEIAFENYRITLGESLYLSWLLEGVPEIRRRRVYRLGIDRGASTAMRCVLSRVSREHNTGRDETDIRWPKNLTRKELLASWGERFRRQSRRGRLISALEEWLGYAAFASMYRVKRSWFG